MKVSRSRRPPASWPLLIIFLAIAFGAVLIGFIYLRYQKKSLLTAKQIELSEISYLKIRQINQWRYERLADGTFFGENNLLVKRFSEFLKNKSDINTQTDILQSLKLLTGNFDFKSAILLDNKGNVRLRFPESDLLDTEHLKSLFPDILKQRKVFLTDIHYAGTKDNVHLDLIVPLIDRSLNDSAVFSLVIFQIDPEKVLYPLLKSWPTLSKSAESLLLSRNGSEVVYLSELRYPKNREILLNKPFISDKLPAIMAIKGQTGTVDGIDYRGVRVVAAMNKIPGTPWYMIAKIDRDEILAGLMIQRRMIGLILVLIIFTSGSFLALLLRNQRVTFYRGLYEEEVSRLALVKHFEYILKYANDIIFLVDCDWNIIEANDRALEYYQYSREEFIGMNVEKIRSEEANLQIAADFRELDDLGFLIFETVHRRKDYSTFPIELSSRIVMIEGNKYYQAIGRDITDRKIAENTLKESEEKFRKIFEESPISILMTDKDFTIIRANSTSCRLFGYTEEELKLFTFRNFTHPDYVQRDEISLMKLIAGEIPAYKTEKQYIRKDKSVLWGSASISLIRNKNNEALFFLAMIEDITQQKLAKFELDNSFSLLKATLESTEDGLLVVNSSGKIDRFNQKFIEMWKIPLEIIESGEDSKALGYVRNELTNPETFLENVKHLYNEPDSTSFDMLEFKDGRLFERYSQPQKINGVSVGRVWSFRDVTIRKKTEAELLAAKVKAEESDKLKTAFLHNVSHEIRTPMNAIIGFSSLLSESDLSGTERQQYFDIIFQSGSQLLSIINDIVDIANVESGQVRINMTEFNLNSALKGLNDQFSINGKQNNVSISLKTCLTDEESVIITDNTKLVQILSNLINNAIKFTKDGSVEFGYNVCEEFLEFFVKDDGIGISAEFHSRIFDRFYQVDNAVSRQYSGTGLGLSICKGYVDLLGGKMKIDSEPGKGTLFVFTIPYMH